MNKITNDEKISLIKKLSTIKVLAIVSLCLIPLAVIVFFFANMLLLLIISWLLVTVPSIISFVSAIIILATDWKNKEINNNKTIWGILALLLLGPIASLVFSIQSLNIYKSSNDDYDHMDNYEKQEDNHNDESETKKIE